MESPLKAIRVPKMIVASVAVFIENFISITYYDGDKNFGRISVIGKKVEDL